MKYVIFLCAMSINFAGYAMELDFFKAVRHHKKEKIRSMLQENPSLINSVNACSCNCLFILDPVEEVTQMLLEAGADVNHRNRNGETPLFWLASAGFCDLSKEEVERAIKIVELFLKYSADINYKNKNGYTALEEKFWNLMTVSVCDGVGSRDEIKTFRNKAVLVSEIKSLENHKLYIQKLMEKGALITNYTPLLTEINNALCKNKNGSLQGEFLEYLKEMLCTTMSVKEKIEHGDKKWQHNNKLRYDFARLVYDKTTKLSPQILSARCPQLNALIKNQSHL